MPVTAGQRRAAFAEYGGGAVSLWSRGTERRGRKGAGAVGSLQLVSCIAMERGKPPLKPLVPAYPWQMVPSGSTDVPQEPVGFPPGLCSPADTSGISTKPFACKVSPLCLATKHYSEAVAVILS